MNSLNCIYITAAVIGYLFGSIPFGLILTKLAGLGDIRNVGSGNIGATNVLRTGNKKLAAAVLFLDGFKGFVAVIVFEIMWPVLCTDYQASYFGMYLGIPVYAYYLCSLFAIIGHIFPVWLKFKGGKGVATSIGALLIVAHHQGYMVIVLWLIIFAVFRISSLSALGAFLITAIVTSNMSLPNLDVQKYLPMFVWLITTIIFVTHRANIRRLLNGEEKAFKKKE